MDMTNQVNDAQVLAEVSSAAVDNASNQASNTQAILAEQNSIAIQNMSGNERLTIAIDKTVQDTFLSTQSAIERNGKSNSDVTYRTASDLSVSVERNGAMAVNTVERANSVLQASIQRTSANIETAQERIASDTRQMLSQNNTAAGLLGKDEQLDITKSADVIKRQALNYYNKTELKVQEVKSELQVQAVRDTSEIQIEAIRNKVFLQSNIESCLCSLKEQVESTAFQTQKTARELETARIRDALNSAKTEELIYRLKETNSSTYSC